MSRAITPDGTDAFVVIATRIAALRRPVEAIMKLGDNLPCYPEFAYFAGALDLMQAAYDAYLRADLAENEARLTQVRRRALGGTDAQGTA